MAWMVSKGARMLNPGNSHGQSGKRCLSCLEMGTPMGSGVQSFGSWLCDLEHYLSV